MSMFRVRSEPREFSLSQVKFSASETSKRQLKSDFSLWMFSDKRFTSEASKHHFKESFLSQVKLSANDMSKRQFKRYFSL